MDGFRRIMEVNVAGSYIVAKQFARLLRSEEQSGSIVLIASMSGQVTNRVSGRNAITMLITANFVL